MTKTVMFGIPNCDTIKKAKKWLNDNEISFDFHDYRKQGIDADWLTAAEAQLGWEQLVNKRGTTYRQLDEQQKSTLNRESALAILIEMPSMIKRPILQCDNTFHIAFKPQQYSDIFAK